LKDTGYIEGETVAIEYRLAENQIERLSALATELVRRQVAAVAGPITSVLVARAVTTTIPIVFVAGEDPVTLGLMTSLARRSCCPRDRVASRGARCQHEQGDRRGLRNCFFFRKPPDAFFVGGDPLFGR
jgi:hypothetical protein